MEMTEEEFMTEVDSLKFKLGTKAYILKSDIVSIGEIFAYDFSTKKYQIANDKYNIWVSEDIVEKLIIQ